MNTSLKSVLLVGHSISNSLAGESPSRRALCALKGVLVAGLLTTGMAVTAGTGSNALNINSYSMAPGVSYSSSDIGVQPTLTAYLVTIQSISSSGANNIWLTARATSSVGAAVNFKSTTGSPCSVPDATDQSLVKCELGDLATGASTQVILEFKVPTATTQDPSTIRFDWSVSSGQGTANNQPSNSNPTQVGSSTTPVTVAVNTPTKSQVQSYVSVGGTSGTDAGQLSSLLSDSSAKTTVKVQKAAPVFIEQNETSNKGSCSPLYAKCLASELRIKDPVTQQPISFPSSSFLTIVLERSTATLKNPSKADINNAVLTYSADGITKSDITSFCNADQGPPTGEVNCIVPFNGNKGEVVGTATWRFTLRASKNGFREF